MRTARKSIKTATLAITIALALIPLERLHAQDNRSERMPVFRDPIVGSWNCQIPPAGGAPAFTVLKNIHVGGTESEIDNAAPPSQESPTIGTWANTGNRNYSQNAYQMSWDPSGSFLGTWNYTGSMTLSLSLKQLTIQGTATFYDPNGNVTTTFPFTASCARL